MSFLDRSHIHTEGQKITKQMGSLTPISQDPRIQTRQLDGNFLVLMHTLDENLLDKTSMECPKLPEPTPDVIWTIRNNAADVGGEN